MGLLFWGKTEKTMPIDDWKSISADGAPLGVYTSNMSREDRLKWKAKLVGQKTGKLAVEIRKEANANIVMTVTLENVSWTANDRVDVNWEEMNRAVQEARDAIIEYKLQKGLV